MKRAPFRLVYLLPLLLSLSLIATGSAGGGSDLQIRRSDSTGTTQFLFGNGVQSVAKTITFSPPFPVGTTNVTLTAQSVTNTGSQNFFYSGNLVMLSDPMGVTWVNMPAASTEIFGNTNNEIYVSLNDVLGLTAMVNLVTASNTINATLRPMYSADGGSTWHELDGTGLHLLDVLIDPTAIAPGLNCNEGPSCAFGHDAAGSVPIAAGAKGILGVYVTMFGFGGGGVGDVPSFSQIQFQMFSSLNGVSYSTNTCSRISCVLTATLEIPNQSGNIDQISVHWEAVGCSSSSTC